MKNGNEMYLLLILATIIVLNITLVDGHEVAHHDNMVDHENPKICLTCHDATLSKDISPFPKTSCLLSSNSSHPIFRSYPPDGKESEYASASELEDAGIKLNDYGVITCISCHNLINQEEFHLVVRNRDTSLLCKTCHKL